MLRGAFNSNPEPQSGLLASTSHIRAVGSEGWSRGRRYEVRLEPNALGNLSSVSAERYPYLPPHPCSGLERGLENCTENCKRRPDLILKKFDSNLSVSTVSDGHRLGCCRLSSGLSGFMLVLSLLYEYKSMLNLIPGEYLNILRNTSVEKLLN